MSLADDLKEDLSLILSDFSKSEKRLSEVKMHKKEVYSITVDIYEKPDYPIVRHTFYGRTEDEAFGYVEAHKETDRFFKGCGRGNFQGLKCKATRPLVKKVQPSAIRASGLPKPIF